jgi:hypothetical protein
MDVTDFRLKKFTALVTGRKTGPAQHGAGAMLSQPVPLTVPRLARPSGRRPPKPRQIIDP